MAVTTTVTLPAQPAQGVMTYVPLGGDGRSAPLGCYFVRAEIDGDAGGGNATCIINFDERYTNLVAYANYVIQADAAAGDFVIRLSKSSNISALTNVVGTIPQVAGTTATDNAAFLWYPPPIYFQGDGSCVAIAPNVGVNETYKLTAEVYVFDIDVRRLTPLPILQLNVPGVSAPAAV